MKRFASWLKWLYPNMGVKRYMFMCFIGVLMVTIGTAYLTNITAIDYIDWLNQSGRFLFKLAGIQLTRQGYTYLGIPLIITGFLTILVALVQFNHSVLNIIAPEAQENLADHIYVHSRLSRRQKIVVVGGGTGLSTMLRGLKEYTSNIVAVVTVTDNGGSSGRLTQQMGVLPPGDIRNCLVALADAEPVLSNLFQYRFDDDHDGLGGHSFGNLFIAAMTATNGGNYEKAIAATSKVLAIRGRVYPSTTYDVCLLAEMEDGSVIEGETQIASSPSAIKRMYLRPENAKPISEVLSAIREADAIILGPGSVFTSIIPNLLIDGIADAIHKSKALKVYVCNVMTQPGESDGFTASDHVRAIALHAPGKKLFNYVLVNTQKPSQEHLKQYEKYRQRFVEPDIDAIRAMGYTPITGNFISDSEVVRHDSKKLADAMFKLVNKSRIFISMR